MFAPIRGSFVSASTTLPLNFPTPVWAKDAETKTDIIKRTRNLVIEFFISSPLIFLRLDIFSSHRFISNKKSGWSVIRLQRATRFFIKEPYYFINIIFLEEVKLPAVIV